MSSLNDRYPVIVDRLIDMQFQHGVQTGGLDAAYYGDTGVTCWQFQNPETGDTLMISDPPEHLGYMFQAAVKLDNADTDFEVELEHSVLRQKSLEFFIDHNGRPFLKLPGKNEYEAVKEGYLVYLLDTRMYSMVGYYDHRVLPPFEDFDLDTIHVPTVGSYIQAAAAVNRAMTLPKEHTPAYLMGNLPYDGSIEQPPNEFGMTVQEEDNEFDPVGFDRHFGVEIDTEDPVVVTVRNLGTTSVSQVMSDNVEFAVGREGIVIRYEKIDDQGRTRRINAVPFHGDKILGNFFRNAS